VNVVGNGGDHLRLEHEVEELVGRLRVRRVRGNQPCIEGDIRALVRHGERQMHVDAGRLRAGARGRVVGRPGHRDAELAVGEPVHVFTRVEGADVGAHRDQQPPLRPVERLKREPQVVEVRRARAYEELVRLPGQRRAGLEDRPQAGQHLLGRAMT